MKTPAKTIPNTLLFLFVLLAMGLFPVIESEEYAYELSGDPRGLPIERVLDQFTLGRSKGEIDLPVVLTPYRGGDIERSEIGNRSYAEIYVNGTVYEKLNFRVAREVDGDYRVVISVNYPGFDIVFSFDDGFGNPRISYLPNVGVVPYKNGRTEVVSAVLCEGGEKAIEVSDSRVDGYYCVQIPDIQFNNEPDGRLSVEVENPYGSVRILFDPNVLNEFKSPDSPTGSVLGLHDPRGIGVPVLSENELGYTSGQAH